MPRQIGIGQELYFDVEFVAAADFSEEKRGDAPVFDPLRDCVHDDSLLVGKFGNVVFRILDCSDLQKAKDDMEFVHEFVIVCFQGIDEMIDSGQLLCQLLQFRSVSHHGQGSDDFGFVPDREFVINDVAVMDDSAQIVCGEPRFYGFRKFDLGRISSALLFRMSPVSALINFRAALFAKMISPVVDRHQAFFQRIEDLFSLSIFLQSVQARIRSKSF